MKTSVSFDEFQEEGILCFACLPWLYTKLVQLSSLTKKGGISFLRLFIKMKPLQRLFCKNVKIMKTFMTVKELHAEMW